MAILDKIHTVVGRKSADGEKSSVDDPVAMQIRAGDKEAQHAPANEITPADDKVADDAQLGVKKIEAVTLTWSKRSVYFTLALYV
jgi:hypothetical protein